MEFSVVVVGGGPSGSLAALRLARAGARVLVIDRERPMRVEAAEILSPEGRAILEREKLWHAMPLDFTWPCPALATAWDHPDLAWTSFGSDATECAWHLDRIRFDAWMTNQTRAAGADVRRGSVDHVYRDGEGWRVDFSVDDEPLTTSARCLILATGRSSRAIRLAPRRRIDRLCLVCGTASPDPVDPDALVVEATVDGWWYSAPLISRQLFMGWMTDFALVGHARYAEAALASLAGAPIHARRIVAPQVSAVVGAASWAMSPAAGPGWLAIGDAALARDPIGGDGLTWALRSACEGADAVGRALAGDDTVWTEAAERAAEEARRYETRRLALYRRAQARWPSAPFWRRF